ncbi:hypothetical protein HanIR_Chr11g0521981 [Helianthus annuus]|nr:hypothetical protein HanIR_Chr11g0521981 [Helianthus annuus]
MTMIPYKNRTPIIPQTKEEIPYDFASLLWGGKVPYGQCLELIDYDLCNCRSLNLLRTHEIGIRVTTFLHF